MIFNIFKNVMEHLISNYNQKYMNIRRNANYIRFIINPPGQIKLFLKCENDSLNKLEFYVLYIALVDNPNAKVHFNDLFYWPNDPNIARIVKISCLREHGVVIRSIIYDQNRFDLGREKNDNIIVIKEDDNVASLYIGDEEIEISIEKILEAIKVLDVNIFFNHFQHKKGSI